MFKVFLLRSRIRQGCPHLLLLLNVVMEVLASSIKQDEEIEDIKKEDIKLLLFVDDMILYVENPKDATKKLLKLISEFSKVAGYKINI